MQQLRTEEFVPAIRKVLNRVSIALAIFWAAAIWVLFGSAPQWVEYVALVAVGLGTAQLLYARSSIIKDVQNLVDAVDSEKPNE